MGDMVVSVNLQQQLADPELVQMVRQLLDKHGCDPTRLELEITESHLMARRLPRIGSPPSRRWGFRCPLSILAPGIQAWPT